MKKYLVVSEVSQKQKYIFKTDRLIENVGASLIIRKVTEEIPVEYSNTEEFVFAGGGKSVYEFDSLERAQEFISRLSRFVLEQYPGLELFLALHDYDDEADSVMDAINVLYGKLEAKKSARRHSFRLFGLGITENCADTAMPASSVVSVGERRIRVSAEAAVKIETGRNEQDQLLKELLPDENGYLFAREFEDLGGNRGVKNYIAVIVIDGNKMGKKIEKFRNTFMKENSDIGLETNRKYKYELRALSDEIDHAYKTAIKNAVNTVTAKLEDLHAQGTTSCCYDNQGRLILPIRPLIVAGDDICIVTDARIGVGLAELILKNIEENTILGLPMRACAGVAIVKTGYPFFRAHELAEELCHNAKSVLKADEDRDASLIDFHTDQGELAGSLSTIRRELYGKGTLTNKPYFLKAVDAPQNSQSKSMEAFRERIKKLSGKEFGRGAIKQYRDALAEGETSAEKYLSDKRLLDTLGHSFENGHCIDFDVIEMMDIYNELEVTS